jgi:uncharacterized protein
MNRKRFLRISLRLLGVGALYSWQIEPFWLEFVQLPMPIKNLPEALVGKKLMQISDMHVGNRFDYRFLIRALEQAKAFAPDFVVYTGDFVSYETPKQFEQLETVLKSVVKGKFGTVGILGNHDYGKQYKQMEVADTVVTMLEKVGVQMLRNRKTHIEGLDFVGFDDYWGMNFDPEKALADYDSSTATVVLCHNPDVCDLDVWRDYQGWILAGHTHGGQVKAPFLPPFVVPVRNKRYTAGTFDLADGRTLYINRALGHLWQIRCNVRPEITIFELQKA